MKAKPLQKIEKRQPMKPPEIFKDVYRSHNDDLLHFRVAGLIRLAKAGLSRLLQQFQNKVDFVILTCYRPENTEQENSKAFQKFPAEYRGLVGTNKVGAFELVGHWQNRGGEEELERSWFFTNGDPDLSGENFIAAALAIAAKYDQFALIISRQGVTTLESKTGEVLNTLTTAGAIENATLKLTKARDEFQEGKRPGWGCSELKRMKDLGRDSKFVFDTVPDDARDADHGIDQGIAKEGSDAYLIQPRVFVGVPQNVMAKQGFSILGMNYPNWPILEK
jgi:hypothetical protein